MDFIPISKPSIGESERKYLLEAFDSGWISSQGKFIEEFEKKFAEYCGTSQAVAVANGTVAIHLALKGLGLQDGDEVIVPDFTFVATANTVRHAGCVPGLVDICRDTLCLDPEKFERAITQKTKAVIPVHLYGHPANMNAIMGIASKHGIMVIEDAAEAHGAEINGKRVGSLGHCATFSFYANKLITTGEGGMISTNDSDLASRLRFLRDHAMSKEKKYWHTDVGYNFRLTNLQAAIGVAQLQRIDSLLEEKKEIFKRYERNLSGIPSTWVNYTEKNCLNSYWMVCFSYHGWNDASRMIFMTRLKERNIDSRPFFYPLSDMPMYCGSGVKTSVAHEVAYKGINLPSFVGMSDEQIDYVCENVIKLLDETNKCEVKAQ